MPPESRLHLIMLTILAMLLGLLGVAIVVGLMLSWRRLQDRLKQRKAKAPSSADADPWQLSAKRLISASTKPGSSIWDDPYDGPGKPRPRSGQTPPRRPGFDDDDDAADPYEGLDEPFEGYDPNEALEQDELEDPSDRFGHDVDDDIRDIDDMADTDDEEDEDDPDSLAGPDLFDDDDPFAPYFGTPQPRDDDDDDPMRSGDSDDQADDDDQDNLRGNDSDDGDDTDDDPGLGRDFDDDDEDDDDDADDRDDGSSSDDDPRSEHGLGSDDDDDDPSIDDEDDVDPRRRPDL